MIIDQEGNDCRVTIHGVTKVVPNCNALKLANTMFNKSGDQYTEEEMFAFGFEKKVRP